MRIRIIAAAIGYCPNTPVYLLRHVQMLYSCSMERFVVCPPCYDEETEGLGLYIDVLLRFESEIKVSATRIRNIKHA